MSSAFAKAFLSWHGRFTVHHDGRVWVDEKVVEKWVELARREVSAEKREPVPMPGAPDGSR